MEHWRTAAEAPAGSDRRVPVARSLLAVMLLRRSGLLPAVAMAISGRGMPPNRRLLLTVAAGIYLGALLLLLTLVALLVAGLAFVVLRPS